MATMTLRKVIELMRQQQAGKPDDTWLDIPLTIGIYDPYRHFEAGDLFDTFPHFFEPRGEFVGEIRLDCSVNAGLRRKAKSA